MPSQHDVSPIARTIENSAHSPDGHTHNFEAAYRQIVQMQHDDGGSNSMQFRQDMADLNQKLHQDGVLPNLQIVGADDQGHLLTLDRANSAGGSVGSTPVEQNASAVNDFGSLGSGRSSGEAASDVFARAMGIDVNRNPDGSYDVQNPFDDPNQAAAQIMSTMFNGLMNWGSNTQSDQNDQNQNDQTQINQNESDQMRPIGMNPLMWQAWTMDPATDSQPDDS